MKKKKKKTPSLGHLVKCQEMVHGSVYSGAGILEDRYASEGIILMLSVLLKKLVEEDLKGLEVLGGVGCTS